MKKIIPLLLVSVTLLNGCSAESLYKRSMNNEAQVTDTTRASQILANLPLPKHQLPVAVYDFQDQTGQFKYNDAFTDYSSAVTKGGLSVLVKALLDTSNGQWFNVAERSALNNLLKERNIISSMRNQYTGPDGGKLGNLPPLIYGGMLLEGGIIFYDSNTLTGGAAAGYFGLSGSAQYHRDIVTVYLRAVNISTGQVILSVNSSKTIFSYAVDAGVTRYLSIDKLLEIETGWSVNEPSQLAVREAIETAVYSLIMEGALHGTWSFADDAAGKKAIAEYLVRRDGPHENAFSSNPAPVKPQVATYAPPPAQVDAAKPLAHAQQVKAAPVTPEWTTPAPAAEDNSGGGMFSWFTGLFGSDPEPEKIVPPSADSDKRRLLPDSAYQRARQQQQQPQDAQ